MASRKGIDISHWQGAVNFSEVAKEMSFVMIKAGGSDKKSGPYTDINFEAYYAGAKKAGLAVGAYWFVGKHFTSAAAGVIEAEEFLKRLTGKQFEYPIALDVEVTAIADKAGATSAARAFCDRLEKAGYYVVIYGSDISVFKDRLQLSHLTAYDKWVARYGKSPTYVKQFGLWQFTSSGTCPGIKGRVDIDLSYLDYPAIMKKHKLNGFI